MVPPSEALYLSKFSKHVDPASDEHPAKYLKPEHKASSPEQLSMGKNFATPYTGHATAMSWIKRKLNHFRAKCGKAQAQEIKVAKATKQIVAGTVYHLDLVVGALATPPTRPHFLFPSG